MITRRLVILLAALGAVLLLAAYVWAMHDFFTSRVPGANDFFSRWAGAHLYFTRGWDPYGPDTSLWIQNVIYGHAAKQGQDPSLFAYPFYTIFLIAPYGLIAEYSWAQAAWQVTLQVVTLAALWLCLRYFKWRPSPIVLGVLVLWTLAFYPTARSLILGQIGVVVFALTVGAFWLLLRARPTRSGDIWAGVMLAITTVKPQMQFLIIPFLILWALRERRWAFIAASVVTMAVLVGVSSLLMPAWIGEWVQQVINYPAYTPPAVLYILTHEAIPLGAAADLTERVLDGLLAICLLYEWWLVLWKRQDTRLDWVLGLTLVITHLIAPRTATTHFIVFIFALIPIFQRLFRQGAQGAAIAVGFMAILVIGMWWLFLATIVGNQESDLVHLPLPILMLALLLAVRPRATSQPSLAAA